MDAADSLLIFSQARIGLAFGLAMCLGFVLAAAAVLLRPWPPRGRRALVFLGVLVLSAAAAYGLARKREVRIDVEHQRVEERVAALGIGRERSWTFGEVQAVIVERVREPSRPGGPRPELSGSQDRFSLSLRIGEGQLELQGFNDALMAESAAFRLGVLGRWPALRRGYRLATGITAGDLQSLQTVDGRKAVALLLVPAARVHDVPGEESTILP